MKQNYKMINISPHVCLLPFSKIKKPFYAIKKETCINRGLFIHGVVIS